MRHYIQTLRGEKIMEGKQPEFKGEGVAVWVNKDKNGKQYLSIKLLGSLIVKAFKNEPKPKEQETL